MNIKYPFVGILIIFSWLITFLVLGIWATKENYTQVSTINVILQLIEIISLSIVNFKNRKKRNYFLFFLNIALILFYVNMFFLPACGESSIFKMSFL